MEEVIIAIIAMSLGYKLLSEVLSGIKEVKLQRYRSRAATVPTPEPVESPSELQARANDLKRRLATLEEIIASEGRS